MTFHSHMWFDIRPLSRKRLNARPLLLPNASLALHIDMTDISSDEVLFPIFRRSKALASSSVQHGDIRAILLLQLLDGHACGIADPAIPWP